MQSLIKIITLCLLLFSTTTYAVTKNPIVINLIIDNNGLNLAASSTNANVNAYNAFTSKIQKNKNISVIIKLTESIQLEGRLSNANAIAAQRNNISNAQNHAIGLLNSSDISKIKRFSTIPMMAMVINQKALDDLINSGVVESISEDGLSEPSLLQSRPMIKADQVANSGFDGTGIAVAILDTGVDKTHAFLDNGKSFLRHVTQLPMHLLQQQAYVQEELKAAQQQEVA